MSNGKTLVVYFSQTFEKIPFDKIEKFIRDNI